MQKIKRLFLLTVALLLLGTTLPQQKLYAGPMAAGFILIILELGSLGLVALGVVVTAAIYHGVNENMKSGQLEFEKRLNSLQNVLWKIYKKDGTKVLAVSLTRDEYNNYWLKDSSGRMFTLNQDDINFVRCFYDSEESIFTYSDNSVLRTSGNTISIAGDIIPGGTYYESSLFNFSVRYSMPLPLRFELGVGTRFSLWESSGRISLRSLHAFSDVRWYPFSKEPKDFFIQAALSAGVYHFIPNPFFYNASQSESYSALCDGSFYVGWKFEWLPLFLTTAIGVSETVQYNINSKQFAQGWSVLLRCEIGLDFSTTTTPAAYIASNYK
ncbi:MAG: hypothetical protein HZC28_03720 [Spirochaetes bacterium]|nr:hypothetical protein [Spirochaetota bacterium]